jgi:hypothetical protein
LRKTILWAVCIIGAYQSRRSGFTTPDFLVVRARLALVTVFLHGFVTENIVIAKIGLLTNAPLLVQAATTPNPISISPRKRIKSLADETKSIVFTRLTLALSLDRRTCARFATVR